MPIPDLSLPQKTARYVLIGLLVTLGAWMLRIFLPALCWAIVLSIGTSSLYDRWLARFRGKRRHIWAALTFTVIVGIVLIAPLVFGGVVAVREAISFTRELLSSSKDGALDLPPWVLHLPLAGDWIHKVWDENVGNAATDAVHTKPAVYEWTRLVGVQLMRRLSTLVFTLLTLYFIYLNRDSLRADVPRASRGLFGPSRGGTLDPRR